MNFPGFCYYPLVMTNSLLLNMAIEIVGLILKTVILHGYVKLPEGILTGMTLILENRGNAHLFFGNLVWDQKHRSLHTYMQLLWKVMVVGF